MSFSPGVQRKPAPPKQPANLLRPDLAVSRVGASTRGPASGAADFNILAQSKAAPRAGQQRPARVARTGQRVSSSHKKSGYSPEAEISAQLQNRMPRALGPSATGGMAPADGGDYALGGGGAGGDATGRSSFAGYQSTTTLGTDRSNMRSAMSSHSDDRSADPLNASTSTTADGHKSDWGLGLGAHARDKRFGIGLRGVGPDGKDIDTFAQKEWTQEELQEKITIRIEETDTMMLLHIPSYKVWGEDEELAVRVSKRNDEYDSMVDRHRERDKYTSRAAQTFNQTTRHKKIKAWPPKTASVRLQASTWEIFDAYEANHSDRKDDDSELNQKAVTRSVGLGPDSDAAGLPAGLPAGAGNSLQNSVAGSGVGTSHIQSTNASRISHHSDGTAGGASDAGTGMGHSSTGGDRSSSAGGGAPNPLFMNRLAGPSPFEVLAKSKSFLNSLQMLEQAVVQNAIHEKQVLYRAPELHAPPAAAANAAAGDDSNVDRKHSKANDDFDPTHDSVYDPSGLGDSKPKRYLMPLWSFQCAHTKGMTVTCLDWNRKNADLLVAGYGTLDFGNKSRGLVLFWSLKNPDWPQKIFQTKHSVTSVDFCDDRPNLLAVGLYDGTVSIYDVTKDVDRPSLESVHKLDGNSQEFGKHSEPVWGLKWVNMGKQEQDLTSISSDGTVRLWSTKKGLVPTTLMRLTRIPNRAQMSSAHMEGVSREASGMCFDFPVSDGTQYYAGTEDGLIHKCSVSYNAQTLENYYGHTGPVYKVRCSPFSADSFLSCSADWTIKLWTQLNTSAVLNFSSGQDYVTDIQWSPTNSCVFGSVNRDGRVEVWNLGDKNPFDPAIKHSVENKHLTCLTFSKNAPVILTGADDGSIDCYRICGLERRADATAAAAAATAAAATAAAAAAKTDKKSTEPPLSASQRSKSEDEKNVSAELDERREKERAKEIREREAQDLQEALFRLLDPNARTTGGGL